MMQPAKTFVLDTNVILHDSGCIINFEEHDSAVPITVLEELDKFKRGNEDINFQAREFLRRNDALTGDVLAVADKLDPSMQPLSDNLTVIRHQFSENSRQAQRIQEMRESEKLLVTPLASIRGRSLQKIFFIVDEAQNLTPHEIKTIITRAGEGTKIVFTGDIRQIDQPYLDTLSNGLSYLINRMVGQSLYAPVTLEKGERSALADLASELL